MPLKNPSQIQPLANAAPPLFYRRSAPALVSSTAESSDRDTCARVPQEIPGLNPLRLSQAQFAVVWVAYIIVSVLDATLALVFAAIYYAAYSIRGGYMIESVGLLSLEHIPIVAAIYAVLSIFFWKLALQAIIGSLRTRRFVFKSPAKRRARQKSRFAWIQSTRQRIVKYVPFEVVFVVREIIEVTTQSYQVYKCSTLISMHWINDFYVATLAVNCWIAPIIHVKLHHNRPLQRFIYICSDVVLDFVSTFVVPVTIISTIVLVAFQQNLASSSGDMEYAFDVPMDDTSFSNMVKAVQQVFVVTWLDVFTKVLPFISMGMCLDQIQNKLSCTVIEINCNRHGFTGYAHEIASALSHVNPAGVGTLIISHCPQLYMPSQIQTLTNLMWLEIFNATLMDWGTDAALIDSKMPALQYLNVIRVNMTELPVGLQSTQFPSRLRDITIALSNLTTLPPDLHTKWKRMVNLVIERTLIDTIPATVSQMNPSRLSLFNNRITHIPSDFFTRAANFWILSIAKNPVSAWPETIGSLKRISLVLIDYTEIAELPRWLMDEGERRARGTQASITVSAGGSPFCRVRMAHGVIQAVAGLKIVCREKADEEIQAYMMSFNQQMRLP